MAVQERIPPRVASAFAPLVTRVFYNDVLADAYGRPARPGIAKRPMVALNQALFERGVTPPWVWTPDRCGRFWASRTEQDERNGPAAYAGKDLDVVTFLNDFWQPEVSTEDSVLELGCNAGPNLEGLRRLGFTDLAGVEINPAATAEMGRAFPELSALAKVHLGAAERVLPGLPPSSHDVVFSMAVLIHVHPSNHRVMAEMVRVSRKYVCVIEAENVTCGYVFARNYRRVFERLGCTEVKTAPILVDSFESAAAGYVGYRARLFRVPG
jgi:SAM-dependent methyltransferase